MRRRFAFALARLARVRELEEREARGRWAAAEREAAGAEAELGRRREALDRARGELGALRGAGRLEPARVLACERVLADHEARVRAALERARTLRLQADELRGAWRERERDRRALEELEARGRERHRVALRAAEAAELDEVAARRSRRREAPADGAGAEPPASDERGDGDGGTRAAAPERAP